MIERSLFSFKLPYPLDLYLPVGALGSPKPGTSLAYPIPLIPKAAFST